jgi:hypothetical protein
LDGVEASVQRYVWKILFEEGEYTDDGGCRLGTYIDVLQIHRLDREVPVEEIIRALNDVVESGKVRYLGASSVSRSFSLLKSHFLSAVFPATWKLTKWVDGDVGIPAFEQFSGEAWLAQVHQHAKLS